MKKIKDYLLDLFPAKVWIALIAINLVGIIVCACCDKAYADSFAPSESVNNSNLYINSLIQTMVSQSDYDTFKDWVAFQADSNDYICAYNINNGNANIIHYYGVQDGDTLSWSIEMYSDDIFEFVPNQYTYMGNIKGSLGSDIATDNHDSFVSTICTVGIFIAILFFVFRIRKKQKSSMSI